MINAVNEQFSKFVSFDNINKLCDRLEKYGDSALRFTIDDIRQEDI